MSTASREPQGRALVDNSADAEQVKVGKRREAQRLRDTLSDLRAVLALPEGRRALWRVLGALGAFQPIPGDAVASDRDYFVRAGMKNAGLLIVGALETADPEAMTLCRIAHLDYERTNA